MEEVKGIKSFIKDAVESNGQKYSDELANDVLKKYNNNYDSIIGDIAKENKVKDVDAFRNDIYSRYDFSPSTPDNTLHPTEKPQIKVPELAEKQKQFRYNPRVAMGMPIEEAKQIAGSVADENIENRGNWKGFGKELGLQGKSSVNDLTAAIYGTPGFVYDFIGSGFRALNIPVPEWDESLFTKDATVGKRDINPLSILEKDKDILLEASRKNTEEVIKLNPDYIKGVQNSFAEGDVDGGIRNLLSSVTRSAAPSAAMMLTGGMSAPAAMGTTSAVFGSMNLNEADQLGEYGNLSRDGVVAVSALTGAIEYIFERNLGSGAAGNAIKKLITEKGEDVAKQQIKKTWQDQVSNMIIRNPWMAPFGEAYEEMGTQLAQNTVNKFSGYMPDIKITDGMVDAGLMGTTSGGIHMSMIKAIQQGFNASGDAIARNQVKKEYNKSIGLLEDIPDANYTEAVYNLTQNYTDPQQLFDTFQEINQSFNVSQEDFLKAYEFVLNSARYTQMSKSRAQQIEEGINKYSGTDGNVTTATINGQEWYIKNPEDLGKPGKIIFAHNENGTKAFQSVKVKDWLSQTPDEVRSTISQEDEMNEQLVQEQELIAEQQQLLTGVDEGAEIVNDKEQGSLRVIEFSNGQSKAIEEGQEIIFNTPEELQGFLSDYANEQIKQQQAFINDKRAEIEKRREEELKNRKGNTISQSEIQRRFLQKRDADETQNKLLEGLNQASGGVDENKRFIDANDAIFEELVNLGVTPDEQGIIRTTDINEVIAENEAKIKREINQEIKNEGLKRVTDEFRFQDDTKKIKEIQAKYDAELAELEKEQPPVNLDELTPEERYNEVLKNDGEDIAAEMLLSDVQDIRSQAQELRKAETSSKTDKLNNLKQAKQLEAEAQRLEAILSQSQATSEQMSPLGDERSGGVNTANNSEDKNEKVNQNSNQNADNQNQQQNKVDQKKQLPYFEDVKNVSTLAQKIIKGEQITTEDKQLQTNFPKELEKELKRQKRLAALQKKANKPQKPRKLSKVRQDAVSLEVYTPREIVLQYLAGHGKINMAALQSIFGNKKGKSVESERRRRISYYSAEGMGVNEMAHMLWENSGDQIYEKYDSQDFREAVEDVILSFNSSTAMAKELLQNYQTIDEQMMAEAEAMQQAEDVDDAEVDQLEEQAVDNIENNPLIASENEIDNVILQDYENGQGNTESEDSQVSGTRSGSNGQNPSGNTSNTNQRSANENSVEELSDDWKQDNNVPFRADLEITATKQASEDLRNRPNALKALQKLSELFNIKVNIIHSSEMSEKAVLASKGINGTPKAYYDPDTKEAYIISDMISKDHVSDVKKSFFHEAILHKGLDLIFDLEPVTLLGKKYKNKEQFLSEVFKRLDDNTIADRAKIYAPDFFVKSFEFVNGRYQLKKGASYNSLSEAKKQELAEETLAELNEIEDLQKEINRLNNIDKLKAGSLSRLKTLVDSLWRHVKKLAGWSSKQFTRRDLIDMLSEHRNLVKKATATNKSNQVTKSPLQGSTAKPGGVKQDTRFQAAWHGSPHAFDKFSTQFMGTGEGAQAYGWGLYFTDKEGIARSYSKLGDYQDIENKVNIIENKYPVLAEKLFNYWSLDEIKEVLNRGLEISTDSEGIELAKIKDSDIVVANRPNAEEKANEIISDILNILPKRNLYKVKIHGDKTIDELNFLRWDKEVPQNKLDDIIDQAKKENIYQKRNNREIISGVSTGQFFIPVNHSVAGEMLYNELSLALGDQKAASEFLLRAGIDGIQYPTEYTSKGEHEDSFNYVVFDENAVEIEDHIRFRIMGEWGAYNLDVAEEATTRMDNLEVAKQMETSDKSPKEIKLATGWERGGDKLWRYETSDIEIKNFDRLKEVQSNAKFEHDAVDLINYEINEDGTYNLRMRGKGATNTITGFVGFSNLKENELVPFLGKEIAEIISTREGNKLDVTIEFDEGVSYEYITGENGIPFETENGLKITDIVNDTELFKAYPDISNMLLFFTSDVKAAAHISDNNGNQYIAISKNFPLSQRMLERILNHELQHAVQEVEGFAQGGTPSKMPRVTDFRNSDTIEMYTNEIKRLEKTDEYKQAIKESDEFLANNPDATEEQMDAEEERLSEAYPAYGKISAFTKEANRLSRLPKDSYDAYHKLGGEVEARNVERRANMSPEYRASKLLQETEDVSRLDQIFIKGGAEAVRFRAEQQDNNLIVMHNLDPDNILNIHKLGGLPVPSIAIARTDVPFISYGSISLIADKSLVDPKGHGKARTFNSDIYSPRYPGIHYDIDFAAFDKVFDEANTRGAEKYGLHPISIGSLGLDTSGLSKLQDDRVAMLAYLIDKGDAPRPVKKSSGLDKSLHKFIKKGHQDAFKLRENPEFIEAVTNIYKAIDEELGEEHFVKNGIVNGNLLRNEASKVANTDAVIEPDYHTNRDNIRERATGTPKKREAFNQWIREKFESMVTKERIFKGYTNSGSKRYQAHTLENVVAELRKGLQGEEGMNYGLGSVRSGAAKEFQSIDEIQQDRNQIVPHEEFNKIKEELSNEYSEIMELVKPYYKYATDHWMYSTGVSESLLDYAKKGRSVDFKPMPTEVRKQLNDFMNRLKHMPTEYFESKVQRAVDLSEFKAAIVPNKTPQNVIDILENKGIEVRKYNPDKEGDRSRKVELASKKNNLRFRVEGSIDKTAEITNPEYWKGKTFGYIHNSQPSENMGAMFGQDVEPAGKYITMDYAFVPANYVEGTVSFNNPLVIDITGQEYPQWKKDLSLLNKGVTGKKLSNKLRQQGYDAIITVEQYKGSYYPSETVILDNEIDSMKGARFRVENLDAKIEQLQNQRERVVAEKNRLVKQANQRNGLFGDTQAAQNDMFAGEGFNPEAIFQKEQEFNAQIQRIDNEISLLKKQNATGKIEASGQMALFRAQTETEAFKNWFGNSKVVDSEGKPLVVYHGTNADFNEFASTKFNVAGYFSEDPNIANNMAEAAMRYKDGNASVYPVFLNIRKPLNLNSIDGYKHIDGQQFIDLMPSELKLDEDFKNKIKDEESFPLFLHLADEEFINQVKKNGFDGIFYQEVSTDFWNDTYIDYQISKTNSFIAFSPTQIKSATGNNGEFDSENPDIRFRVDPVDVNLFKYGEGGTKGLFQNDNGTLFKSLVGTWRTVENGEIVTKYSTKDTNEYEILKALQGNPNIPVIGERVETNEGPAFEIERLEELTSLNYDEYNEIKRILKNLNDQGYFVNDIVSVMKRPGTGELVIVDFSSGFFNEAFKGESYYSDASGIHRLYDMLSVDDQKRIKQDRDRELQRLFSDRKQRMEERRARRKERQENNDVKFRVNDTNTVYSSLLKNIKKGALISYLQDNGLSRGEINEVMNMNDTYWIDEYFNDTYGISVTENGFIQFDELTPEVIKIIGNNEVQLYHHTASGILSEIQNNGLQQSDKDVNRNNAENLGVYLTTEYSGPVVDGYKHNAVQAHGGFPLTLEVVTAIDQLQPDENDADISSGRKQFVVTNVNTDDILNLPDIDAEQIRFKVDNEANNVNTNPTNPQKHAGNYKMGHVRFDGFDISIENPKGSIRSGKDKTGREWQQQLPADYGYFRGTKGRDKDHIDVFIGPKPENERIYVVDQVDEKGNYDEAKVMLGFDNISQARNTYLAAYEKGWKGLGEITRTDKAGLKEWFNSDKTTKPFYNHANSTKAVPPHMGEGGEAGGGVRFAIRSTNPEVDQLFRQLEKIQRASESRNRIKDLKTEFDQALVFEKPDILKQIKDLKEGIRMGQKDTKAKIKAIQSAIIQYAQRNMPYDEVGKRDMFSVINKIRDAQTPRTIEKAFEKIDEITKENESNKNIRAVERLIKWMTNFRQKGQNKEGKFTYETVKEFEEFKRIHKEAIAQAAVKNSNNSTAKQKAEADKALEAMWQEIDQKESKSLLDLTTMKLIELRRNGRKASKELIQAIREDLQAIYDAAKDAKTAEDIERVIYRKEDRDFVKQFLDGKPIQDRKRFDRWMSETNGFLANSMGNWETILTMMGGYKLRDKYSLILNQVEMEVNTQETFNEVMETAMKGYKLEDKKALQSKINEMKKKEYSIVKPIREGDRGEGSDIPLSKLMLIDIYNAIQNEKIREDYYFSYGDIITNPDDGRPNEILQRRIGKERIDKLMENLNEGDIIFAKAMQQAAESYWGKMNDVFIRTFNRDLPKRDNYWPSTAEFQNMNDAFEQSKQDSLHPSSTKELATRRTPLIADAFEKFARHIKDGEWYTNMAIPVTRLNNIFKNPNVKDLITDKYGEDFHELINKHLAHQGLRPPVQSLLKIEKAANWLLDNWIVSAIGLTVTVPAKQLLSVVNYTENMPPLKWATGFIKAMANPAKTWKEMMETVPYLKVRLGTGYSEAVQNALNSDKGTSKASSIHKSIKKWLTIGTRYGDIAAIIFGGKPYLDYLLSTGMDQKEAVDQFLLDTLRSQQAPFSSTLSLFQNSKTPWKRAMFAFSNTPSQYNRKLIEGHQAYKRGDISAYQWGKVISIYGIINNITWVAAGMFFSNLLSGRDDWDEFEKSLGLQIAISLVGGLPGIKDAVDLGGRLLTGLHVYESMNPIYEGPFEFADNIDKAIRTDDIDKTKTYLLEAAKYGSSMIGIGGRNVEKIYKATIKRAETMAKADERQADEKLKELAEPKTKLKGMSNYYKKTAETAHELKYAYSGAKSKATRLEGEGKKAQAERLREAVIQSKANLNDTDFTLRDIEQELKRFNSRVESITD
ncbi:LPD23 domain-containing protein [Draconibacterium sp.]|uniref:ADP-ribosyltransferase-containing protein n=1 Tax=Draconibacterium sp. TaxID=1965318 RepID=UPI003568615D